MTLLRDIMREGFIFAVQRRAPVSEAAHVMEAHNIGIVAVLDGERLCGVFSERDVVRRVVEDARIVLGAVHTAPVVATDAGEFLRGRALDAETIEMAAGIAYKPAKPLDNADLSYAWRKRMARIEVARALREVV